MNRVCDILVVGGGISGISAAIAASREGAQTVLVEQLDQLGGTLSACLNFPVCGLFDSEGQLLNSGFAEDLMLCMDVPPERMGRVFTWPCAPDLLMGVLQEWVDASANLQVLLEAQGSQVNMDGERIASVSGESFSVSPRMVIDCSGDGVVAALSSAEVLEAEQDVLAGYTVRFSGLGAADSLLAVKVPFVLRQACDALSLDDCLRFSTFAAGREAGEGFVKLCVPREATGEWLRFTLMKVTRILREQIPVFAQARVVDTSPCIMRREGLRMRGEYVLTRQDVLSGAHFEDGVVKSAWPIEYWDLHQGPQLDYLEPGTYYEIPLRCLKSENVKNLYAAGRCISASSEALGSTRVMGTCFSLGEAVGRAAVQALERVDERS